jgi:RecJ-like exonuclease
MPETTILTHADPDGICAGAIALTARPGSGVFFTRPTSLLQDLRETASRNIVIADIALTKQDAPRVLAALRKRSQSGRVMYFDHHSIPPTVARRDLARSVTSLFHARNSSASELVYRHFMESIPRERVWLAIYGAIGDYSDETPFVRERMLNWDRRAIYFETSAICMGIKSDQFSGYDSKRRVVRALSRGLNPSQVPGLVKVASDAVNREFELYEVIKHKAQSLGGIGFVRDVPSFGFRGPSALFAATVSDSRIGVCAHTRERYIDITMRTRDYSVRLNLLADRAAESVGGSGGGHPGAAGAKIPLGTFTRFLRELDRLLTK